MYGIVEEYMAFAAEAEGGARPLNREAYQQAEATRTRAVNLMHERKYGEAAPLFQETLPLFARDVWFLHDYGQTLTAEGGRENVNQAIGMLTAAVELDQAEDMENDWVHVRLGEAFARRGGPGDYDRARTEYQKARSISSENPETDFLTALEGDEETRREEANRLHTIAATEFMDTENYVDALRYYEKAIILAGEEGMPWSVFDKGKALLALELPEEAVTELEKSTRMMPQETWTHSQLGLALAANEEHDRARAEFEEALRINPDNDEARQGLAQLSSPAARRPWYPEERATDPVIPAVTPEQTAADERYRQASDHAVGEQMRNDPGVRAAKRIGRRLIPKRFRGDE